MDKDTPIFATSIARIRSYSKGRINELETEMMEVRMKTFSFYNQFQQHEIKELPPFPKFFADFLKSSFSKNRQYIETNELF